MSDQTTQERTIPTPATERELLALPWEDYIAVCWAHARPTFKLLAPDQAALILMEALWARRYWMAKCGQWEFSDSAA